MKCPECGTSAPATAKVCSECGVSFLGVVKEGAAKLFEKPVSVIGQSRVIVTDFDMPFDRMVMFMIKWAIATIPAMIILGFFALLMMFVLAVLGIAL